ncbi:hypothetical protein ABZW18_18205 [Streptomyces sp. NPDC004647]|uniref:hypothetical protein n=1 Tax=Streptomyces sp. NPDC004647 TaxID=3154671 RepID=UPI0033BAE6A6
MSEPVTVSAEVFRAAAGLNITLNLSPVALDALGNSGHLETYLAHPDHEGSGDEVAKITLAVGPSAT